MQSDGAPWDLTPLPGGWSGRTWRAGGPDGGAVVRLFPPDLPSEAPEVEAAVLSLVRGLVPVPDVLEVRRAVPAEDRPGLLVTSYVEGTPAELAWGEWDERRRSRFGTRMGELAAALAGMPFLGPGRFVDAALTVRPWPAHAAGLESWVDRHRGGLAGWSEAELAGLGRVARTAQQHLDRVRRVCLVHSDLNPKNVLVEADSAEVVAVVDWEYAHAGHPATDLGNLLRLHRDPGYVAAVLAAHAARHGGSPEELRHLARCADLWALVDLAARREPSPPARRAGDLLRAIAREQDVHAWPEGW